MANAYDDEDSIENHCRPIVVENGTGSCRLGFAGDDAPRLVFPTMVGRPRHPSLIGFTDIKEFHIGEEAQTKRGILKMSYPVENGYITNFDDMEKIWHYGFNDKLLIETESHHVLLTEPTLNPIKSREKMGEIMFESFNVPSLCIVNEAVLALYSYGTDTGLNVDLGISTKVVPVFESKVMQGVSREFDIKGDEVTFYLADLLRERGYEFAPNSDKYLLTEMKERLCHVVLDFEEEMKMYTNAEYQDRHHYELCGGEVIKLGDRAFRCPEVFFQPSLKSESISKGIHQIINETVMKCEDSIQFQLLANIALSGGCSLFPGLEKRLHKELKKLVPPGNSKYLKISASPNRQYASWAGGSLLASSELLSSYYQQLSITKEEYGETDPAIVHQKVL